MRWIKGLYRRNWIFRLAVHFFGMYILLSVLLAIITMIIGKVNDFVLLGCVFLIVVGIVSFTKPKGKL